MEIAGKPIYDHGLTDDMLEDLARLRQLRVELVVNQLNDLEQTKAELESRELIAAEKLEISALREALEQKHLELKSRLNDPKAIFMDEIQFFLEVANG